MSRKPIDEAVKDFEDAWNKHDLEQMKEQLEVMRNSPLVDMRRWIVGGGKATQTTYDEAEKSAFPLGIINFDDTMITDGFPHYAELRRWEEDEEEEYEEETDAQTEKIMEQTLWMKRRKEYQSWKKSWKEQKEKQAERMKSLEERVKNFQGVKFRLKQKQKYGDLEKGRPPHAWEKTDENIIWEKWAVVDLGTTDSDRRGGLMKYGGYGRAEPKKYLRGHLYWKTPIKEGWLPKKQKDKVGKPYSGPLHSALGRDGRLHTYGPEYFI